MPEGILTSLENIVDRQSTIKDNPSCASCASPAAEAAIYTKGAKLPDIIKQAGKDTVFYVGTERAFIFIGTKEDYFNSVGQMEKSLQRHWAAIRKARKPKKTKVSKKTEDPVEEMLPGLSPLENSDEDTVYTPLESRKVISIRESSRGNGIVITVAGKEYCSLHMAESEGSDIIRIMEKAGEETLFYVGSGSAFFFIGTMEDFLRYNSRIASALIVGWETSKSKNEKKKEFIPLEKRKALSLYKRNSDNGMIILVEGEDKGPFWTRGEFQERYKIYDDILLPEGEILPERKN